MIDGDFAGCGIGRDDLAVQRIDGELPCVIRRGWRRGLMTARNDDQQSDNQKTKRDREAKRRRLQLHSSVYYRIMEALG